MRGVADPSNGVITPSANTDTDASRLDGLFRSEAPRLQRYFRQKTGDREVASDLVQDSFVRLVSAYNAGLGNPAAYLQRIARNLVFDRYRREGRSSADVDLPLDYCDVAIPPMQEDGLTARDLLRLYETAIKGLSDKTRTVFLLSRVEGLTYEAIRLRLGVSMGTVEYHMMRAIAHVDRVLEEL